MASIEPAEDEECEVAPLVIEEAPLNCMARHTNELQPLMLAVKEAKDGQAVSMCMRERRGT